MKSAPELQRVVTQLALAHGVPLDRPGAYLRLEQAGHGQLVIEHIGGDRISVTNYIEIGGDLMADPQVVLYTAYRPATASSKPVEPSWVPIESTDFFHGWRLFAELDFQGELLLHDAASQVELAEFCDTVVAKNLISHGWLENTQRRNTLLRPWSEEEIRARDIRIDEIADAGEET